MQAEITDLNSSGHQHGCLPLGKRKWCRFSLSAQEMMELRIGSNEKKEVEDEPTKGNLAGGCCFDFNKVCLPCFSHIVHIASASSSVTVSKFGAAKSSTQIACQHTNTATADLLVCIDLHVCQPKQVLARHRQQQQLFLCWVVLGKWCAEGVSSIVMFIACMQAQDHLFVVGTEEGHIHKCSQAYNSEYLQTYQGMPAGCLDSEKDGVVMVSLKLALTLSSLHPEHNSQMKPLPRS